MDERSPSVTPGDPKRETPADVQADSAAPERPQPQRPPARESSNSYVTYTLLVITVLVYLLQVGSENLLGVDVLAQLGLKVNSLIAQGQLWRLITPILLHGSILHIGFNMYALYLFGPRLETNFGRWRFLAVYLLSGFAGNVFSMMFTQASSLGSSTAIFGLLGAHGVFVYQNKEIFRQGLARASLARIIQIAVINLLIGLSPGIDNWGHIGGLVGGTLFTWIGGPLFEVKGVFPALEISDRRDSSEVLQAIAIVGGFFAFLALGALYLMEQ